MIVLRVKNNINNMSTSYPHKATFYFKNIEDCNKFLYVFKDHFCNVPWETPKEIPDNSIKLSENEKRTLDKDPVKRAQDNLSWGFSLCSYYKIGVSSDQLSFVHSLMEKVLKENE